MLLFEDVVSLYENLSVPRLVFLTSPFLACIFYRLLILAGVTTPKIYKTHILLYPYIAGGIYCSLSWLAANSVDSHTLKLWLLAVSAYSVMLAVTEIPVFQKIAGISGIRLKQAGVLLSRFPVAFTALFIALLVLPSLFYGFDVTDGGYHLSQGLLVFHEGLAHANLSNYLFLTCYFSGAVTAALQYFDLGLMALRLTWLCFFIAPIAITIHILRQMFGTHWLLPFMGLAAAANCSIYTTVLEYETVPSFFAALFLYALYRTYRGNEKAFRPAAAACLGITFFLVLLSRVTTVPLIIVFVLPVAFALTSSGIRKNFIVQCLAFASAFGLFVLMLHRAGNLAAFFTYTHPTDQHSSGGLVRLVMGQVHDFAALQLAGVGVLLALLLGLAMHLPRPFLYGVCVSFFFIITAPLFYWGHPSMPNTLPVAISVTLAIFTTALYLRQSSQPRLWFLLIMATGLLLPGALGGGSDSGITKLMSGNWLLLPLSLVLLLHYARQQSPAILRRNLFILVTLLTFLLIGSGFRTFHRYPYGDHYDRRAMTGVFEHPRLKGIHTIPGRKESFESLLTAISKYMPAETDRIFAYNNIPMIFYASHTYPLFSHTWITCLSLSTAKEVADRICTSAENTPGLIVRTKVETRSGNWGNEPSGPPIVEEVLLAKTKLDVFDAGIKKCNATVVWQNHDFQVLKPNTLHSGAFRTHAHSIQ